MSGGRTCQGDDEAGSRGDCKQLLDQLGTRPFNASDLRRHERRRWCSANRPCFDKQQT
jgi:hypothetical protein